MPPVASLVELERLPSSDRRDLQRINALEELVRAEIDALRLGDARGYLLEARAIAVGAQWDGERLWLDDLTARIDVIEGRVDEGVAAIRAVAESARAGGEEEGAVWAYRDATLMAIRGLAFAEAGRFLEQGLDYAEAREHSHCGHIMASATALVAWAEGRWSEAVERGQHALVDEGSARARSIAQCALGFTAMGRGERRTATAHLEPAAELARRAGWLEVSLPAVWGMAEAALADGDAPAAIRQCEEALTFGRDAGEWALLGPFAVTGVRSYQVAGRPDAAARWLDQVIRAVGPVRHVVEPAIDHATGLVRLADGSVVLARESFEAAIRGWDARGRRWEGLWARLDLASALLRSNRYAAGMDLVRHVRIEAERMGSVPLVTRADQLARSARGRGGDVDRWHPLTTREFEVGRCIADGMTNAAIAETLGISPKTAASHVEHILAKLGATRRAEIATWVTGITLATPAATAPTVASCDGWGAPALTARTLRAERRGLGQCLVGGRSPMALVRSRDDGSRPANHRRQDLDRARGDPG